MCSGPGETWGLSVNEAMNFGLPIIVSNTCGCSSDLVQNEINGFIVEEGNSDQLKQAMSTLLAGKIPAERIKQHALKKISEFSIPAIMKELKAAVNEC